MDSNTKKANGDFDVPMAVEHNHQNHSHSHKDLADYMLSQDSIQHLEEEADKETKEERAKLQAIERQRKEFAK